MISADLITQVLATFRLIMPCRVIAELLGGLLRLGDAVILDTALNNTT